MMMQEAKRLNQIIRESEEYKTYVRTMKRVQEETELYHAMNAFRRRNYELQSYEDGINRYQEICNLSQEYEKVLRHPVVNDFLVAEQIFSRKLAAVYEVISEGMELDYDYME